jgi:hypothetical protein
MKTLLYIIIFTFGFIEVGFCQSQANLLKKAYKKKSIKKLNRFFENWANETPDNVALVENDTILEAYKVFEGFYKPTQPSLIGGSEWGDSIYSNVKYYIVQSELINIGFATKVYFTQVEKDSIIFSKIYDIHRTDTTMREIWIHNYREGKLSIATELFESDSIVKRAKIFIDFFSVPNFFPKIDNNDKAVYLTSRYSKILNNFLGKTHSELGDDGIMNPAQAKGSSKKKKDFLDGFVKIFYGHWGGYWQLITYPYVFSITFDKDMKYAKVEFRMIYEGGEAILEKQGNKWVIIHGERSWIE